MNILPSMSFAARASLNKKMRHHQYYTQSCEAKTEKKDPATNRQNAAIAAVPARSHLPPSKTRERERN